MLPFIFSIRSLNLKPLCLLVLILISGCATTHDSAEQLKIQQLKDQAVNGDTASQYQLGVYYTTENQWPWEKALGYGWFMDAAKAGDIDAQYMVGMGNLLGRGTLKNTEKAITWLTQAADQGHGKSQYQLAQIYLNGRGVSKDILWGRYWLEQAAWSDHPDAQFLLSALFRKGVGGSIHHPEALVWLNRAAQNGQKYAQKALPKLTHELSEKERLQAKKLALQSETKGENVLSTTPKIRYIQAVLNQKGFSAGTDDGVWGVKTSQAIDQFLLENKLPRDTTIDQLLLYLRGIQ